MNPCTIYYREGRIIYRIDHGPTNTRLIRLATARTRIGAAMTVKVLRGEIITNDWRKYL